MDVGISFYQTNPEKELTPQKCKSYPENIQNYKHRKAKELLQKYKHKQRSDDQSYIYF